jgi:hypothetical protein
MSVSPREPEAIPSGLPSNEPSDSGAPSMPASSTTAPPASGRDGQLRTEFWAILDALCHSSGGALAACLVDEEGETVDMAARQVVTDRGLAPSMVAYRIKLCGAHWQLVMRHAARGRQLSDVRQIWVLADDFGYLIARLQHDYVLALACRPESLGSISHRAIRQCEVDLCLEAGWDVPDPHAPCWRRAGVRLDPRGDPMELRLRDAWIGGLEGLGAVETLAAFERGFRVRTPAGHDLDLVREPSGFWYAGGSLETLVRGR